MKKVSSKLLSIFLTVIMTCSLMVGTAVAADWQPTDKITISVSVFDIGANKIYRDIGTDTVEKGDQYIQSKAYRIPELSKFTSEKYGMIQEVTGTWYGYNQSSNVGANVYFSCNNNTGKITYWVSSYGESGSTGGNTSGSVDLGSGSKEWNQTLVYHSNYPDGTDATVTVNYHIKSYVDLANHPHKSYADCGFTVPSGYTVNDRWNTAKDGSGDSWGPSLFPFNKANAGTTTHLYAQYTAKQVDPDTQYVLSYYDGSTKVGETKIVKGESVQLMDELTSEGKTFLGWSTTPGSTTADYKANATITPQGNMDFYAVWETTQHKHVDGNGDGYCDEDGACMHDKNTEGYCTVEGCTHDHGADGCCPKQDVGPVDGPAKPADGDIAGIVGNVVTVKCIEKAEEHPAQTYGALDGGFTVGSVYGSEEEGWKVNVTFDTGVYKDQFTADNGNVKHYYKSAEGNPVTLEYNAANDTWTLAEGAAVVITTTCKDKQSEPGIEKKANGNDSIGTQKPGAEVNFTLTSTVPEKLADSKTWDAEQEKYVLSGTYELIFHDKMSSNMTFNADTLAVTIKGQLLDPQYYTVVENQNGDTFTVTMDLVNIFNNTEMFTISDMGKAAIVVSYTATVAEDAKNGDELSNGAQVTYPGGSSIESKVTGDVSTDNPPTPPTPPVTGGMGTGLFTVIGAALMASAAGLYVFNRRRSSENR